MSDILDINKNISLSVYNDADHEMICKIAKALSIPERLKVLQTLLNRPQNLSELSRELNMPVSSVSRHIDALADAQLILIYYQPGQKGHAKYCSQTALSCNFDLDAPRIAEPNSPIYTVELPVGLYSHCHIKAPCGMCSADDKIAPLDEPRTFFLPERTDAEIIWFSKGFVDYNFPSPSNDSFEEISFSFEICSETQYYNNNWPSDITIKINDVEVLTFTSPGDFGGRRGNFTPTFWPLMSTQFGLLKKVTVTNNGVYLDNSFVHKNVQIGDLKLQNGNAIKLTIGIKEDAVHCGGINLFGKRFGDYEQAIVMTLKRK